MADHSHIEWTDATWNPVTGCTVLSPGCKHCYAMGLAGGRLKNHPSRVGLTVDTKNGPVWTGEVRLNHAWLGQPLEWKRPRRIFVCAHGDLFHEEVPMWWIAWIYGISIAAVHLRGHTLQVLTKRTARARHVLNDPEFWELANAHAAENVMDLVDPLDRRRDDARATLDDYGPDRPPPGIWLGFSAEDQERFDERAPELRATPAAVRFISFEPLLGPIDARAELATGAFHQAIVGGESGPKARPMHPEWARQIRDASAAAGVAFFFKQWGAWRHVAVIEGPTTAFAYMAADGVRDDDLRRREKERGGYDWSAWWFENVGKTAAGRLLDGVQHDGMPREPAPEGDRGH